MYWRRSKNLVETLKVFQFELRRLTCAQERTPGFIMKNYYNRSVWQIFRIPLSTTSEQIEQTSKKEVKRLVFDRTGEALCVKLM